MHSFHEQLFTKMRHEYEDEMSELSHVKIQMK